MYCFRIYDISGSSDEESDDSDADSDKRKDDKVKKAVTGMHANSTTVQLFLIVLVSLQYVQAWQPWTIEPVYLNCGYVYISSLSRAGKLLSMKC